MRSSFFPFFFSLDFWFWLCFLESIGAMLQFSHSVVYNLWCISDMLYYWLIGFCFAVGLGIGLFDPRKPPNPNQMRVRIFLFCGLWAGCGFYPHPHLPARVFIYISGLLDFLVSFVKGKDKVSGRFFLSQNHSQYLSFLLSLDKPSRFVLQIIFFVF